MSADAPQPPASSDLPAGQEAGTSSATPPADPEASRYEQAPADGERTHYVPTPPSGSFGQTGSWPHKGNRDLPRRFGNYELLAEIARGQR